MWVISSAFRPYSTLFTTDISFIPKNANIESFKWVFLESDFFIWLKNSLIVYIITVIVTLFITIPAAYAFSRFNFLGKGLLLNSYFILSQFMSGMGIVALIPLYTILVRLKLINSLVILALVYTASLIPYITWYLKTFIDTIPKDFDEAALIDGASFNQIWRLVILPLAKPGIYTALIFISIIVWSEWVLAGILLNSDKFTMPVGLVTLQGRWETPWNHFSAMALIYAIPMLILFIIGRRYLKSGLTIGGLKQ
ncbi:MAG: ABC transporter permease subunit [Actinobacteria bacterium]|nr:ABC transporter permease subunit [Cyanobacteriota bacterium]MCL5771036.1 ABC transporter permease subunit [Actinomycetota bacterium]